MTDTSDVTNTDTTYATHSQHNPDTNKLFENVKYYIINTNKPDIAHLLDNNGAQQENYLSQFITHVICDHYSNDNSDCSDAKEVFELNIVNSDWVTKCLFANALLPVEPFTADDAKRLFQDVKALNINLPNELAKELMYMIHYYGGTVSNVDMDDDFRPDKLIECGITHAFSIDYDQLTNKFDSLKSSLKLVTPDWVSDCVSNDKLLDELEYNPKFLLSIKANKEALDSHEQKLNNEKLRTSENEEANSVSDEAHNQAKRVDILENVKTEIILNDYHQASDSFACTVDKDKQEFAMPLIQIPQAEPTSADNHSSSNNTTPTTPTKQKSKRSRKQNDNSNHDNSSTPPNTATSAAVSSNFTLDMNEIFQTVIGTDETSAKSPDTTTTTATPNKKSSNLIKNMKITNSDGPSLPLYLNVMKPIQKNAHVKLSSATPALNVFDEDSTSQDTYFIQENSHLIQFDCCLLGCVFHLKPSESYYTSDCLNDWQRVIERFGGRVSSDYNLMPIKTGTTIKAINQQQEITHVLCPNRQVEIFKKAVEDKKRIVTPYWLEDVLQEQVLRSPWLAYHFPSPFEMNNGPLTNHVISTHGFVGKEKLIIKTLIWLLNGKYSSHLSNISSFLISKNSDGIKVEKAKQWNISIVNGVWLSELYLGNTRGTLIQPLNDRYTNLNIFNHFAYDPSYVVDLMEQWKTLIKLPVERIKEANQNSNSPLKQLNNSRSPLKRYNRALSASPTNENCKAMKRDENVTNANDSIGTANTAISWIKPQSNIPIVLFTGFDQNELSLYQRDVIGLGGIIAKQITQTTHLIVDKIERTAKLLKCISTVEYIVHIKWLIDSKQKGKFLDPLNYQIKDDRFEKHYSCCLQESLARARENKPLFNGLFFYLSPSVRPSYADLEEMVRSAGGVVVNDIPNMQKMYEPFKDDKKTGLTSRYVIIGAQSDLCILRPFIEKKIPIYHEELVLSGILRQKLDSQIYKLYVQ